MKVTALAPAMGAEITGLDLAKGDFKSGLIDDIRAVWLEHHLLVLRDQNLSPQSQLELYIWTSVRRCGGVSCPGSHCRTP